MVGRCKDSSATAVRSPPSRGTQAGAGLQWGDGRGSCPGEAGTRLQLLGSSLYASHMSILRVANVPISQRARCFLDNDDLGHLGCASTLLYATVSIALTRWAVWDPSVPGRGQWVGSPMALRRPFLADGRSSDVAD